MLQYVGHNRTDFMLSELPFEIKDLTDMGQTLIENALNEMEESGNYDWYKSIF